MVTRVHYARLKYIALDSYELRNLVKSSNETGLTKVTLTRVDYGTYSRSV